MRTIFFSASLLLTAALAWAEPAPDSDAPAQGAAAAAAPATATPDSIKVGNITISGSLRSRLYVWDWFQPAAGQNQYEYSGNLLRVGLSEQLQSWDWNAEFAVPFLLGLPTGATDAAPQGALGLGSNYYAANGNNRNTAMIFPKQLYARFRRVGGREGSNLQVGRFLFLDGSELAPKNTTLATLKRDRVSQQIPALSSRRYSFW